MATILNNATIDVLVDGEVKTIPSNDVEVEIISLSIVKSSSSTWTIEGGTIHYCVAVTNNDTMTTITDTVFRDDLDGRLTYVTDSFTVDNNPETPVISGQEISFTIPTLAPGQTVNICFTVSVGSEV